MKHGVHHTDYRVVTVTQGDICSVHDATCKSSPQSSAKNALDIHNDDAGT